MRILDIGYKSLQGTALSLGNFALVLLAIELNYGKPAHEFERIWEGSLIGVQDSDSLDYHVWRIYPENRRGPTVVVVSVNPKHFNHNDMVALASKFNSLFAGMKRLRVGLLDDADTARLFVEGRVNYPTYERAERGRYYLDRAACKEFIQFSAKRGKPRETVRFNCQRRQR